LQPFFTDNDGIGEDPYSCRKISEFFPRIVERELDFRQLENALLAKIRVAKDLQEKINYSTTNIEFPADYNTHLFK
jgi:hypothetical protein